MAGWTSVVRIFAVLQGCSCVARLHWLHGRRESASALLIWLLPRLCTMVKSNSCNFSIHRANCPSGSSIFCSHVKDVTSARVGMAGTGQWSRLQLYVWHSIYLRSGFVSRRLPYAITCSLPSSPLCDSTAPLPVSLASVSRVNAFLKLGWAKTGACERSRRNFSKACWQSVVHMNLLAFSVSRWSGFVMFAKSLIKRR